MLICSESFLSSLQSDLFGVNGTDAKSACIGDVIIVKYSKIHLQSFSILKVGDARLEIWIESGYIKSAYISSISTVKRSEIHLWLSRILEFGQYCIRLETKIRASW